MSADDDRDRLIDAIRVGSIVVVVLGHWLMAAVVRRDGVLRADNALAAMPWLQPLTWALQVVPLFFVAAGFANARSLSAPGRSAASFWSQRVVRVVPTPMVMATTVALVLVAVGWAGAPTATLQDVGAVVAQPLWFLAVYLLVALVAPLQLRLHRRHPWSALTVLPVAAGVLDVVRLGLGLTGPATLNYLLVFAFAQELGFWYADGPLQRWPRARWLALAAASTVVLVALTSVGPYPVSMIGLPGQRSNMAPPTVCVAVLTVGQVSLLMAGRPWLLRRLSGRQVWRVVTAGNALALPLFVWHLGALVIALAVAAWAGLGTPAPGSAAWWVRKPVVLGLAVVALWALVAATLSIERRLASVGVRRVGGVRAALAVVLCSAAFAALAAWGLTSVLSRSRGALLGVHGAPAVAGVLAVGGWTLVAGPWWRRAEGHGE